jgi:regulator of RNase E activity RraA
VTSTGLRAFAGAIATVRVPEEDALVRQQLEQSGEGRVGITFAPGMFLYADEDGLIVADRNLLAD